MPEPGQTVYYVLDDGGAVARLLDGWKRQVWRPSKGEWVDYDIDFGVEGREITEEEAKAAGAAVEAGEFGEFAPVDDQEGEDGSE